MTLRPTCGLLLSMTFLIGCGRELPRTPITAPKQPEVVILKKKLGLNSDRPMTPEQIAIAKVLDEEVSLLRSGLEAMPVQAQPSQLLDLLDTLLESMMKKNINDCPPEFQSDHRQYVLAWQEVRAALSRLPDAYHDGKFLRHFQALFTSDELAERALGGELKTAVELLLKAQEQCYNTARQQGLVELE